MKTTPLYEWFKENGAKIVDFHGWAMPVQFSKIKEEHHAVRNKAGLFDVSHMGEIAIKGEGALDFLQYVATNDISKLKPGAVQYTALCYENGGTVDDLLIFQRGENEYWMIPNASNIEKDYEWLENHAGSDVTLENISEQVALLAIQGPKAETILQKVTDTDLGGIKPFKFQDNVAIGDVSALVSRTGYTGEDGFEMYCKWEDVLSLWKTVMKAGEGQGLLACGLGARDTLRFEAQLLLYGQDLSPDITPVEAGIGFAVKIDKDADFIGKSVLRQQKTEGVSRKLVGLEMVDKGIPRPTYEVFAEDKPIGQVTTGTQSPTLKKNVAFALLERGYTGIGTKVEVAIRGKYLRAEVVKTPFYSRKK